MCFVIAIMRLLRITIYISFVIFVIMAIVDTDGPITVQKLINIDGGTVIFFSMILTCSLLYAFVIQKFAPSLLRSLSSVYVGIISNILSIATIYIALAIAMK